MATGIQAGLSRPAAANILSRILECRNGTRGKQQRSKPQTLTRMLKIKKMRKRTTCHLHAIYVDVRGKKFKILWLLNASTTFVSSVRSSTMPNLASALCARSLQGGSSMLQMKY